MILRLLTIFALMGSMTLPLQAESQFCGGRLSQIDQLKLYNLTLEVLQETLTEMKATSSLNLLESLKNRKPQRLHVVGNDLKKAKGRIHASLCYQDTSKFLKCSEVYQQIGNDKKLSDVYNTLISQPLKAVSVAAYGAFVALELDPKHLTFKGKPVSSALHISLIKIRENEDLQKKIIEKLTKKLDQIGPFKLEKTSCRVERKNNDYVKQPSVTSATMPVVQEIKAPS